MATFAQRLDDAVRRRGRLCVGLDPHPGLLRQWGLDDDARGLRRFVDIFVEALGDRVAVVKPQSAFFECYGSAGIAVLESGIRQLTEAGALVLLDVKRGDIGSTAAAYGRAYLESGSPLAVDAITVSPYLGFGSLRPMIDLALRNDRGIFVLALTSNPEGPAVQQARAGDGRRVAQVVIDEIAQVNKGSLPYGSVGAVIGATTRGHGCDLSDVNGPLLAPGLGAQGAGPEDLAGVFGPARHLVLPSYSREILRRGPTVEGLRAVTQELRSACMSAFGPVG